MLRTISHTACSGNSCSKLIAQRLHCNHVLGERVRELEHLEQGVRQAFDGLDAGPEGKEEDVDPGQQVSYWPADEDEKEKPEDCPDKPRTEVCAAATLSRSHC